MDTRNDPVSVANFVMTEWHKIPMMPTAEMNDRQWNRVIEMANEKFGRDAVGKASAEIERRFER